MIRVDAEDGGSIEIYKSGSDNRIIVVSAQSYDTALYPTCLFLSIKDLKELSKKITKFLDE